MEISKKYCKNPFFLLYLLNMDPLTKESIQFFLGAHDSQSTDMYPGPDITIRNAL